MGVRRSRDAGLTLVELMITLVVASLVGASTYVFFTGQQRMYDTQTKLLNVQQNITAAMEMMSRYVRAAGGGMLGCVRLSTSPLDPGAPTPVSNSDLLPNAPAVGLRAFLLSTGAIRIPPLWIVDGAGGAPDEIAVAFGNGGFGNWADAGLGAAIPVDSPTAPLTVAANVPSLVNKFMTNEFVLVLDVTPNLDRGAPFRNDRGCTLFQITGVNAGTNTLSHASTSKWNPAANVANMVPFAYTAGTPASTPNAGSAVRHLGTLTWVRFAIRPGTNTGPNTFPPALTMQRLDQETAPQVLADGIEDLQVAYACDSNSDGDLPDGVGVGRTTDEWRLNTSAVEVAPAVNCNRPSAVRLTLVARSLTPDSLLMNVSTNAKPAVENGAAGTVDQYRHRVLTTTVFPRNLEGVP
jgi:prepilin-type N-terminal cleavage/methylation domain-containing protein